MKKKIVLKKSITTVLLTLCNCICSFLFARNMYIDRMPPVEQTLMQEIIGKWLMPAILLSTITASLYYIVVKKVLKEKISLAVSFILLIGLILANMLVFAFNVNIVY